MQILNGVVWSPSSSISLLSSIPPLFQGFQQSSQPWWRINLFVWEPVLFGTWDGVFTTCMINIFGVVLFLRTGYLVVGMQHLHTPPLWILQKLTNPHQI